MFNLNLIGSNMTYLNFAVIFSSLVLASCSQVKVVPVSDSIKPELLATQETVKETNIYKVKNASTCEGCIKGAFSEKDHQSVAEDKKIYTIEEQTDFNLKNTTFDFPVVYNNATKKVD
jgi:hypothetical protein